MSSIYYVVIIIAFISSPLIIGAILRHGLNTAFIQGTESNSKNMEAGALLARRLFVQGNKIELIVEPDLSHGASYYMPMENTIHIGKVVDTSKCMAAIAECYHELGHADIQNEMNAKQSMAFYQGIINRRSAIPLLSLLGWASALMGSLFIQSNSNMGCCLLIIGITFIACVLHMQNKQVKNEREASDRAIQHLISEGFTNSEIQEAQSFLDIALNTYKLEMYSNAVKYIVIVLLLFCYSLVRNGSYNKEQKV